MLDAATTPAPPRDGTEFWATIANSRGREWPNPVKLHWYRVPADHPSQSIWGDALDGWSGAFEMSLWRGDAHIVKWWAAFK